MKKVMKLMVILAGSILLTSCVDESYTSEYYSSPSTDYYDNVTSGYNRDYNRPHHNRDSGYYSAPSTSSNNSSGYYSSGSTSGNARAQAQAQRDSTDHSSGSTDNSSNQQA